MKVTILVGLPNSGKSTYAKKIKGSKILDCDIIRQMLTGQEDRHKAFDPTNETYVWATFDNLVNMLVSDGEDFIVANTNCNLNNLRCLLGTIESSAFNQYIDIEFVVFDATPQECVSRGISVNMIPVIHNMKKGFDKVVKFLEGSEYEVNHIENF